MRGEKSTGPNSSPTYHDITKHMNADVVLGMPTMFIIMQEPANSRHSKWGPIVSCSFRKACPKTDADPMVKSGVPKTYR